jgi:hypothetical protein
VEFIAGRQDSVNVIHHTNRIKEKNEHHFNRCKKEFAKIHHPYKIKSPSKLAIKGNLLRLVKGNLKLSSYSEILSGFFQRSRTRQDACSQHLT